MLSTASNAHLLPQKGDYFGRKKLKLTVSFEPCQQDKRLGYELTGKRGQALTPPAAFAIAVYSDTRETDLYCCFLTS